MTFDKNIRKSWFRELKFLMANYGRREANAFLMASIILGFTAHHFDLLQEIIDKHTFVDELPF